jgi:hypothetical protein
MIRSVLRPICWVRTWWATTYHNPQGLLHFGAYTTGHRLIDDGTKLYKYKDQYWMGLTCKLCGFISWGWSEDLYDYQNDKDFKRVKTPPNQATIKEKRG